MNHLAITVITLAPFTFLSSAAASWISGDDLERHCSAYLSDPAGTEGAVCTAFVQGYLSAEGTTYAWDTVHDERFSSRAARTRVGSRLRNFREDYTPPSAYCVDGIAPAAVVEAVASHLSASERTREDTPARDVHRALVAQFPCSDS